MSHPFHDVLIDIAAVTEMEEKDLTQLALKTSEETGELAQAVLSVTGAPGCKYKGKTHMDVVEEAVDVILCASATMFKTGISHLIIAKMFRTKLDAWTDKITKEKSK